MNREQSMIHEHISMKECMLYLNSKFLIPTTEQFETLSPIISKLSDCPTCRAICHRYKELGRWLESEIELAGEATADVTDTLPEYILGYIERVKQAAQELGNIMIDSFFVQPQLALAVTRSSRGNGSESDGADIAIHDVGDGFFSFTLVNETDMSIKDFSIKEIPQQLKDDLAMVKLVIKRVDDEQQAEISAGVLDYDLNPAQISFEDVCLPAGNYVFYLAKG